MTKYRTNTIFTPDGHTDDWLVYQGQLRLREAAGGEVTVIGSTQTYASGEGRTMSGPMRTEKIVSTGNTPRRFQPLVGQTFTTMKDARAAVLSAIE